jgi:phage protein D
MRRVLIAVLATVALPALAKLPPLSDEAKAKAAEAAARTAHGNKVADYQLCKSMDRVAATYLAEAKKQGKDPKPTATPSCADPGAFTWPPDTKPLEAAGAHSPPKTASTPPNTAQPASPAPKAK